MKKSVTPTTMAGVARAAGVSVMTVSRVLRGEHGHAAATVARVKKACVELGYRPDPLVGALMQARRRNRDPGFHGVLAFINTRDRSLDCLHPNIRALEEGAREQAMRSGFKLEEFRAAPDAAALNALMRVLRARGIPGALWLHLEQPGARFAVDVSGIASATIGFSLEAPAFHRATNFQLESMQKAIEKVLERGYQRPGYVTLRQSEMRVHRQWASAWIEHRLHTGNAVWPDPLILDATDMNGARKSFLRWMRKTRIDVILTSFQEVLSWVEAEGWDVPGEVGLVSLDATPGGRWAGIDQQWPRIGAAAVDLITGQLNRNERGEPSNPRLVMVAGQWQEGRTLRAPAADQSSQSSR